MRVWLGLPVFIKRLPHFGPELCQSKLISSINRQWLPAFAPKMKGMKGLVQNVPLWSQVLQVWKTLWFNCKQTQSSQSRFFLCKKYELLLRLLHSNKYWDLYIIIMPAWRISIEFWKTWPQNNQIIIQRFLQNDIVSQMHPYCHLWVQMTVMYHSQSKKYHSDHFGMCLPIIMFVFLFMLCSMLR